MAPSIKGLGAIEDSILEMNDIRMREIQKRINYDSYLAKADANSMASIAAHVAAQDAIQNSQITTTTAQAIRDSMGVPSSLLGELTHASTATIKIDPPPNLEIKGPNGELFLSVDANKKEIIVSPDVDIDDVVEQFLELCQIEIEDYSYAQRVTELEARVKELEEENSALEEAITQDILDAVDEPDKPPQMASRHLQAQMDAEWINRMSVYRDTTSVVTHPNP